MPPVDVRLSLQHMIDVRQDGQHFMLLVFLRGYEVVLTD